MTLPTPIINKIDVFDANDSYTFTFTYFGSQAVKNQLVIRDNVTNEIVYDKTINSMRLSHEIKSEEPILENGKTYNVQVKVFNANDEESNFSEQKIFTCHSIPTLSFSNIGNDKVVTMLNLTCYLSFVQNEQDKLKSFRYYLYDSIKKEILSSETFYSTDNMVYTYYDLNDNTTYYIRATGNTSYGFDVDTGYVRIQTKSEMAENNISFIANNNNGRIYISSNIVTLDYELDNNNYVLENGYLTLVDNSITYKISNNNDFSIILKVNNLPLNKTFLTINRQSDTERIDLSMLAANNEVYCKLKSKNNNSNYTICKLVSTIEEYENLGDYVIELHMKDSLYSLKINKDI